MANNKYHAVRYYALGNDWDGIDDELTAAINYDLDPTDMIAYVTTTDDYPDVRGYDGWYGFNGFIGWVDCPENNTGTGGSGTSRWCRGQILRFNADYQDHPDVTGNEDVVACHDASY